MKLELIVIPVSDPDRAKAFYSNLGWRLDADFASGDDFRVMQFTPPGSPGSVIFGKNVTAAAPGSAQGLYLIVSDIEAARKDLLGRGIEVSEVFHGDGRQIRRPGRALSVRAARGSAVPIPRTAATARSPPSRIPTAMAGCSRKSPRELPGRVEGDTTLRLLDRSRGARCGVRRPRTASTRSEPAASTMRTGRTGTPNTSSASRPARSCRCKRRWTQGAQEEAGRDFTMKTSKLLASHDTASAIGAPIAGFVS